MKLIMLRHGETEWNVEQRLQGHDDSSLSENGVRQVLKFAPYARALLPAAVVSSDLGRARQTATLIGCPAAPSDGRLRPRDPGDWTGMTVAELLAEHPSEYRSWRIGAYVPAGAEPWDQFRSRVSAAARDWLAWVAGDVLAIIHGCVIRAACHEFAGLAPTSSVRVTAGMATILDFPTVNSPHARLEAYNIGPFLPDEAVECQP